MAAEPLPVTALSFPAAYKNLYTLEGPIKELFWVGSSLQDLRAFPEDARRIAGHQLHLIQQGLEPDDWKSMATVGSGIYELRIHTAVEHRVFYVAKFKEGVYVLHAFQKTAQRTPIRDLELARDRYQEILKYRKHRLARR